jgi:hypothetical protein
VPRGFWCSVAIRALDSVFRPNLGTALFGQVLCPPLAASLHCRRSGSCRFVVAGRIGAALFWPFGCRRVSGDLGAMARVGLRGPCMWIAALCYTAGVRVHPPISGEGGGSIRRLVGLASSGSWRWPSQGLREFCWSRWFGAFGRFGRIGPSVHVPYQVVASSGSWLESCVVGICRCLLGAGLRGSGGIRPFRRIRDRGPSCAVRVAGPTLGMFWAVRRCGCIVGRRVHGCGCTCAGLCVLGAVLSVQRSRSWAGLAVSALTGSTHRLAFNPAFRCSAFPHLALSSLGPVLQPPFVAVFWAEFLESGCLGILADFGFRDFWGILGRIRSQAGNGDSAARFVPGGS